MPVRRAGKGEECAHDKTVFHWNSVLGGGPDGRLDRSAGHGGGGLSEPAGHADRTLPGRRRLRYAFSRAERSEEHTSELQSLMRNSYAVSGWKKKEIARGSVLNSSLQHD